MNKVKYSIVTPARNEEKIINKTIDAIMNQSILPQKWIIIDDGSTDRTGKILDDYEKQVDWIEVIHIEKKVKAYRGVQEKLFLAIEKIDLSNNDYIGKLDADIELPTNYYELLFDKFNNNHRLGIAGGTLYHLKNGGRVVENDPENHVRGGLKLYRKKCWKDIGGMEYKLAYDMIDEIKANMFGWETISFNDIYAKHHRPTGKRKGVVGWCFYRGHLAFLTGYHPIFLFFRCIKNCAKKPFFVGGIAEFAGFFICYFNGTERSINDPEFLKFLNRKHMKRILKGRFT